jgi:hypothetical protein
MRHIPNRCHWEKGVSSMEFAMVLPVFLGMVFFVFGIALGGFNALWTAAVVPVEAREAGVGRGSLGLMDTLSLSAEAGSPSVGTSPTCERALLARLEASPPLSVPLLPEVNIHLRGGSVTRNWQFWAGPPDDGCN